MSAPTTAVVICAFADDRLELTVACVEAALAQTPAPTEAIVVVDHNPALGAALGARLDARVTLLANGGRRGLSAARNTAIAAARAEIVVFLDDDARPRAGWLAGLLGAFEDASVIGAGGRAVPDWQEQQPDWFPDPFLWVVGCSYAGQPDSGPVRNPLGCNMAFRREVFERAGLFDTEIGRLGSRPLGCEETELCIRAARLMPGGRFELVSGADIDHWVPQSRGTARYLLRRCYYEGISKALVRTLADPRSLDTERSYVTRTLSSEILAAAGQVLRGPRRGAGAGRAAAVIGGLGAAVAGYLHGTVLFAGRRQRPSTGAR